MDQKLSREAAIISVMGIAKSRDWKISRPAWTYFFPFLLSFLICLGIKISSTRIQNPIYHFGKYGNLILSSSYTQQINKQS